MRANICKLPANMGTTCRTCPSAVWVPDPLLSRGDKELGSPFTPRSTNLPLVFFTQLRTLSQREASFSLGSPAADSVFQ